MSSPVLSFYRSAPDDVYSFNVNTGCFNQTTDFALYYPVQDESLAIAVDRTTTTCPLQDFGLDTASQSDWQMPVPSVSQPGFTSDLLSLNPGAEPFENQLRGDQHIVDRRPRQSQGHINDHGEQGDSIPPLINQSYPPQSVTQNGVCQITGKT
ncbi:uncharacterized protein P174DRAFT_434245 [Aspergillus novofumigatus IBT 16806]|uniref:Uncharacterized protein n=1 Tax=Aspergillus novofumigatus (strain IBT 16806) TaxID=1392255 RepID=A0A2I1C0T2_ASPN1|nr:uncharacterized protein P174DRAFT_434245 [Aspergillus novofumigatus IBT 16806]PKX91191.1 hypothetical protein P174DRAFT_434245 [Aspergillus novofumigatus IBT 16806]